jgi:hypothetical protein
MVLAVPGVCTAICLCFIVVMLVALTVWGTTGPYIPGYLDIAYLLAPVGAAGLAAAFARLAIWLNQRPSASSSGMGIGIGVAYICRFLGIRAAIALFCLVSPEVLVELVPCC